ncbi:MAG: hypothetical protein ACLSCU_09725 [Eubacterium sp.]
MNSIEYFFHRINILILMGALIDQSLYQVLYYSLYYCYPICISMVSITTVTIATVSITTERG